MLSRFKRDYPDDDLDKDGFKKLRVQRKGEKKTFYCSICKIELNSEDTMTSHVNGAKHRLKMENTRTRYTPENVVKEIANPESSKKKVPIRLEKKIRAASDSVVGLVHIKEFIPVSDSEMEPHYECTLCGNHGQANGMLSHLTGGGHRRRVAENGKHFWRVRMA